MTRNVDKVEKVDVGDWRMETGRRRSRRSRRLEKLESWRQKTRHSKVASRVDEREIARDMDSWVRGRWDCGILKWKWNIVEYWD